MLIFSLMFSQIKQDLQIIIIKEGILNNQKSLHFQYKVTDFKRDMFTKSLN